jgi:hypothetical protein
VSNSGFDRLDPPIDLGDRRGAVEAHRDIDEEPLA